MYTKECNELPKKPERDGSFVSEINSTTNILQRPQNEFENSKCLMQNLAKLVKFHGQENYH